MVEFTIMEEKRGLMGRKISLMSAMLDESSMGLSNSKMPMTETPCPSNSHYYIQILRIHLKSQPFPYFLVIIFCSGFTLGSSLLVIPVNVKVGDALVDLKQIVRLLSGHHILFRIYPRFLSTSLAINESVSSTPYFYQSSLSICDFRKSYI
ncbi:hypothetical protein L6452_16759 [Arctium lappa]|uniref:Uncharacterized protein n=1 Tax=Arctium lappa TaxID=4217 RepID=A0ACB9C1G7_ARCLA|nr:hypothetical protein L6452_16759 [Arctium lappa]